MTKTQSLVVQYVPLANKLAFEAKRKSPNFIDVEDLKSSAYLGLVEAANRYKEEKNYAFSTFAYKRILGSIHDFLRKQKHFKYESSEEYSMENAIDSKEKTSDDLENIISFLDERGKIIIKSYFVDDLSMKDISLKINMTEGRISQLIKYYKKVIRDTLLHKELFSLN